MTTTPTVPLAPPPTAPLPLAGPAPSDRMRVVRVLLLLELVVALVTTLEALIVAAVGFGTPVPAVLTGAVAVVLAVAARDAGRGTPGAVRRRWLVLAVQVVFLAAAGVDVVIAMFEGVAPLLLPALVRIALPATVLVLLRGER
ncbi:hypothetical protein [Kineosporia sp. A_224]|uniref:hypothetical protein n=1 Tax=Kineosporia sp. A_224 TaxID=1962180 RepID=UPI000B4B8468|nr:hypothetical protein [Kineosporia sp. A_224]